MNPPSPDPRGMCHSAVQLPGPGPHAGVIIIPVSCCRHGGRRQLSPAATSLALAPDPDYFWAPEYTQQRHFLLPCHADTRCHAEVEFILIWKAALFLSDSLQITWLTAIRPSSSVNWNIFINPSNAYTSILEMHLFDVLAVKPLTVANQVILGKFIFWCQSSLHCVMLTPWPHHTTPPQHCRYIRKYKLVLAKSAGDNFLISTLLCC